MNKEKLKKIFTSKISIGIISFIIGGIAFSGSGGGVNLSDERYNQLLEFEKLALKEGEEVETLKVKEEVKAKEGKAEEKEKKLALGETAYLSDENGVKLMSVTLDSAKLIDERNEFSDKKAEKVVLIEYTYENLGLENNLHLFEENFKVYDDSGNILETYPATNNIKFSKAISKGKKCTATMAFALNNEKNNLEIEFYENMFDEKPSKIFNIDVN